MIGTPVATLPDASGKASVSRLADLGSKPDLLVRGGGVGRGRECPRSSHTGDSMIGTPVATLPDARRYRVSAGAGGQVSVDCDWVGLFVGWLLNVPATCECISGTDLL